ncbi:amino acid ABC transporter permease [Microvirga sp. 2MCAF38]|uniref:amino acid ABC transporter permease n=1 Tax=Microvirga sp. 2MCAF38 TaxID=3232989 RepID=UPI003F99CEA8
MRGLRITVSTTIVSMVIGIGLGTLLAVAGLSRRRSMRMLNGGYVAFFRGTPVLVQIMLVYFGLPYLFGGWDMFPPDIRILGIFNLSGAILAGVITFALHEAAYMSEITRAGIDSVDPGQSEAAKSLGMEPALAMRRIILPQAIPVIIPPLGNQCNAMFKTTSLLSVIAVPELFLFADSLHAATYRTFEVYLAIAVYYLLLTLAWTLIQYVIEWRLGRRYGWASAAR